MININLFIIGTHKAGTSALSNILNQHDDICFYQHECHHFEKDLILQYALNTKDKKKIYRNYPVSKEQYISLFKPDKQYKYYGDKTPSYIVSETSALEIFNYNPDAKIIFILREPISYMYSLHSQNLYNGYENIEDFETALRLENERKIGKSLTLKGLQHKYMLMYRKRIKYIEQINRYVKLFPKHNIKCVIYEEYKNSNKKVIEDIENFLGINHYENYFFNTVNVSKKRINGWLYKLSSPFSSILHAILPNKWYKNMQNVLRKRTIKEIERNPINKELKESLKNEIRPMVIELEKYLKNQCLIDKNFDLQEKWSYK